MVLSVSVPRRGFLFLLPVSDFIAQADEIAWFQSPVGDSCFCYPIPPVPNRAWPPISHHFSPYLNHLNTSFQGRSHTRHVFFQNPRISMCLKNQGDTRFLTLYDHYLWHNFGPVYCL
jgi:hypothetical protein